MPIKRFYEWGRSVLRRIDIFDGREDTAKKTEIVQIGKLARLHQRILDMRRKNKYGRHRVDR